MKLPKFDSPLDDADINLDLTPLIDVIFMLLIFFILTTTFAKPIMEVLLPNAKNSSVVKDKQFLDMVITKDGEIFYQNNKIDEEELRSLLLTQKSTLNIIAHKEADFGVFVKVLDLAKELRNGEFVITTDNAQVSGDMNDAASADAGATKGNAKK